MVKHILLMITPVKIAEQKISFISYRDSICYSVSAFSRRYFVIIVVWLTILEIPFVKYKDTVCFSFHNYYFNTKK